MLDDDTLRGLLATGHTQAQIARSLGVSIRSIEQRVRTLGLTRTRAMVQAEDDYAISEVEFLLDCGELPERIPKRIMRRSYIGHPEYSYSDELLAIVLKRNGRKDLLDRLRERRKLRVEMGVTVA